MTTERPLPGEEALPAPSARPPLSTRSPLSTRAPLSTRPTPLSGRSLRYSAAPAPPRHPLLIPLAAAYAMALFAWSFLRHKHFGSGTFELGAYHSVLWNVAHRFTPWNSLERAHQWSTHLEPALAVLAPFYRIAPSPVWLWMAESLCVAAAALPIDAIARRITGDAVIGLLAAAAMLLGPQLVLGQLADFHVLALCALPVAVMAWAVEVDSSRGLALGALFAMLLREQMGILVAAAALAWVVRQGKRRALPAIALGIAALSVSALEIFVVIPAFGGGGQSFHYVANYSYLGGAAGDAARSGAAKPVGVLSTLLDPRRARYVAELLSGAVPLCLLALRMPRRAAWPLVLGAPQLAIQLLSSSWHKWSVHYPYGMPVAPVVAVTAVLALASVPTDKWRNARRLAATGWLALMVLHLAGKLPSPWGPGQPIDATFRGSPRVLALSEAIARVPADASISAQDDVVPHVAARSEVHLWPDGSSTDEYILLDLDGTATNVQNPSALSAAARTLRADARFEIVVDRAGVILAKRRPTHAVVFP
ncbi:Hypothetical protein A7982_01909 [Minicystis rosea]|nr:Hypothetical protein A7982_01909 [Minicystis rosea]